MFKIIQHRVNNPTAYKAGIGIECDVWNYEGKPVLSHDYPLENCYELRDILNLELEIYAVNAKSTNLQLLIPWLIGVEHFVFDCSVPEAIKLANEGLTVFTRHSEYEHLPSFYDIAKGVWMDMFHSDWVDAQSINSHFYNGKTVAITSPELHGRDHRKFWERLKNMELEQDVYLCTKFPEEAEKYFS